MEYAVENALVLLALGGIEKDSGVLSAGKNLLERAGVGLFRRTGVMTEGAAKRILREAPIGASGYISPERLAAARLLARKIKPQQVATASTATPPLLKRVVSETPKLPGGPKKPTAIQRMSPEEYHNLLGDVGNPYYAGYKTEPGRTPLYELSQGLRTNTPIGTVPGATAGTSVGTLPGTIPGLKPQPLAGKTPSSRVLNVSRRGMADFESLRQSRRRVPTSFAPKL